MAKLTVADINQYSGTTINPLDNPGEVYELYSVPSFDSQCPEIIKGSEIGSSKITVEDGDVLVCKINPRINRVWVVKHHTDHPLLASSEWIVVRNSKMDSNYLKWYFSSPTFRNLLVSQVAGIGGSLTRAQPKQVAKYPVPIVDIYEQRRIAAVLDKVSGLIAKRREQLDKLDELVKARFVEMFGDPVSNPKGWNIVELSHCLEGIDNGKSLVCDTRPRQGNWPAILKLSAATYGYYQPKENKAMLNENEFVNSAAVQTGDLLFTRKNTPELVGMCAYVYETPDKLMMPDLIFRLNTNETCNKIFLWKLINHELFRENIKAISSGSAKSMSNISKERLLELKIILPPIGLQRKFADFVRQTDKSKLTIQQSLDKLEVLKKALMQQYFG